MRKRLASLRVTRHVGACSRNCELSSTGYSLRLRRSRRRSMVKSSSAMERTHPDRITVDGREIKLRPVEVPIERVRLDSRNPRVANTLSVSPDTATDSELQRLLQETLWSD